LRGGPAELELREIRFRYPGAARPALDGVSLSIPRGALVGVTGPVGAGKSALARAALGLYPLEAGRILLDGQPLDEQSPAEIAARVGYLPQDGYLFSGTVRENVLLGEGVARRSGPRSSRRSDTRADRSAGSDAVLERAVGLAALAEDLRGFAHGADTEVGELGVRVSGGQRQRIALARAIAGPTLRKGGDPGLLILDDPFSAVDVDTELRIVGFLREAFGPHAPPERRATILLCSHRLAAFPQADQVVVLSGGAIEEQGTHASLMAADGLYARIYRAQRRAERSEPAAQPGAPAAGTRAPRTA
jgi:ABC-type multidrug transport system fused ATPase/permease subunit